MGDGKALSAEFLDIESNEGLADNRTRNRKERTENSPTMPANGKGLQLQEIMSSDLEEVARFITRASGSEVALDRAIARLSWILLENPARHPGDPLGWLLHSTNGEVVGCMGCAPQRFCFGQASLTLMMASSFYVDQRHRGAGTSIFLKYLELGRRYPLFVSSADATVAEVWRRLSAFPLGNSDHEVVGVLRWTPVLAEGAFRKTGSDRLAWLTARLMSAGFGATRKLRLDPEAGEIVPLATAEEAASLCEGNFTRQPIDKITSCRDAQFLRWRYFSHGDPDTRVFAFRPSGAAARYMVAVRLLNRGYKQQINALHVLDIHGEPDPKTCLAIAACLCKEYRDCIDMIVFRCLNPLQQQVLTAHGFEIRRFAKPIAWCLDKHALLPSDIWYFVPADGDMFL